MNLKQILNDVLAQSSFLERNTFAGSTDVDDRQMVAIANRVAFEIRDFYNWGILRKDFKVNMLTDQTRYKLPDDLRLIITDS